MLIILLTTEHQLSTVISTSLQHESPKCVLFFDVVRKRTVLLWIIILFECTGTYYAPNISGFIAQLVEHRTGNCEVTGSNPVEVLNFFQASLGNCINCVHCDNHFFIFSTYSVLLISHKWFFWYMYMAQMIISRGIIVAKLLSAGISAKEILRFLFFKTNSRFSMKRTLHMYYGHFCMRTIK